MKRALILLCCLLTLLCSSCVLRQADAADEYREQLVCSAHIWIAEGKEQWRVTMKADEESITLQKGLDDQWSKVNTEEIQYSDEANALLDFANVERIFAAVKAWIESSPADLPEAYGIDYVVWPVGFDISAQKLEEARKNNMECMVYFLSEQTLLPLDSEIILEKDYGIICVSDALGAAQNYVFIKE